MPQTAETLYQSQIRSLPLERRGKVRDLYRIDEDRLLIVASDRLSAFDVVLPTPIPGKGAILTAISSFWFARTGHLARNHVLDVPLESILADPDERQSVAGRATVVRALEPLAVEAIVRGYLAGSAWRNYQASGAVCGIELPAGLRLAEKLPEPVFTPSTKAAVGEHDENIDFDATARLVGEARAAEIREISLALYREAEAYAAARGILIADTKFEFGLDAGGGLVLIDELLTPDSSRFWPADQYRTGASPPSFDKQYVRDYLERLDWDKRPPGPELPPEVVKKTAEKYREAKRRLMNQ
ncbi:MAG: phosphoribosylaminoimidazolesuccinocarboxamide synthase [Gammaproteobacteria bacterium]|nr:phosphoribosylaminoimidazolesuccinocarboxamide synthase [Gammaproteobacteria bacterium]